ncbi:MAG: undecaprenyl-phosphate galactose phosphotransferase WbaP [Alphaproteobacteria bacterium]|nr:undecaprenyl-phosphate galactose phosphotransferase WbaP [Alphaproteobacteria bacterium]
MNQLARKIDLEAEAHAIEALAQQPELRLAPPAEPLPLRDIRKPLRMFMVSDAVALTAGFIISWLVAAIVNHMFFDRMLGDMLSADALPRLLNFAVISCGTMLWLGHKGHYRSRLPFWSEVQQIAGAVFFCILIDGFMQFAAKQDLSRLWLMSNWLMSGVLMVVLRSLLRSALKKNGRWEVRTLLVGMGPTAIDARAAIMSEQHLGYNVVAQIGDLEGHLDDADGSWTRLCNWYKVDYVLVALDGPELQKAESAIAELTREDIPFAVSPPLHGIPVLGMEAQYFFNHDVMLLTRCNRLEEPLPRFIKRTFDIALALGGLIALSPLFAFVSACIKRDGGPAFYFDKRIGENGKMFSCIKFRSMVLNGKDVLEAHLKADPAAAAEWARDQKLKHDPRITRIGAFIRKTSIDELPQLINVIKGDMSLVGPRPINTGEVARYGRDATFYHSVRPGLTGLWQVSGRNDVSYERRVQLDRWYVRNWSLWHDIAILCKTFPVLLCRKGAY